MVLAFPNFVIFERKSIPKKFFFQGSFIKLIPANKFFRIDLSRLIRDYSLKFIFTFIFTDFLTGSFPIIEMYIC